MDLILLCAVTCWVVWAVREALSTLSESDERLRYVFEYVRKETDIFLPAFAMGVGLHFHLLFYLGLGYLVVMSGLAFWQGWIEFTLEKLKQEIRELRKNESDLC